MSVAEVLKRFEDDFSEMREVVATVEVYTGGDDSQHVRVEVRCDHLESDPEHRYSVGYYRFHHETEVWEHADYGWVLRESLEGALAMGLGFVADAHRNKA